MSQPTLLGAVVQWFDASVIGQQFASQGGLWLEEVPAGSNLSANLPRVALEFDRAENEWDSSHKYVHTSLFQFHVYQKGLAATEALLASLKAVFDWTAGLDVQGSRVLSVRRTTDSLKLEEARAADGAFVYHGVVEYAAQLERTY